MRQKVLSSRLDWLLLYEEIRGTLRVSDMSGASTTIPFRVLSLDGGGAKGFYTLGVLKEIEALTGQRLHQSFDLIFGTSTGSIIAALLALGTGVDEIHELYKAHVPTIMRCWTPKGKSRALASLATEIFGTRGFGDVKTGVGIVATRWDLEKPMVFKGESAQAYGRKSTFVPGFGCTIADAVQGSCSAYPFFRKHVVTTSDQKTVTLIDGGYAANNPTLYAIADAVSALGRAHSEVRVVSIGVGVYPEPKKWTAWFAGFVNLWVGVQLLQKTLSVNTSSMDQLRAILFNDIQTVRINDTFAHPELATDFLEHDLAKLNQLYQRGSESFANSELALKTLLGLAIDGRHDS